MEAYFAAKAMSDEKARGEIIPITRPEAVARALQMVVFLGAPDARATPAPIAYELAGGLNGGADPSAKHCGSPSLSRQFWSSDCVGLVAWSLGFDRCQPGFASACGSWLNCTSMLADAERTQKYFAPVDCHRALPGDVLITSSHVGLIVRPASGEFDHLVVDCSPRHGRHAAINTGLPWSESCRVLRYARFAA